MTEAERLIEERQNAMIERRRAAMAALSPAAREAQDRIWAIECRSHLTEADYAEIRRLRLIK